MLRPAIAYKEEIQKQMALLYYTPEMRFYLGWEGSANINIADECEPGFYQYASVDKNNKLEGYIAFQVDRYERQAYQFGLISFKDGMNLTLAKDLRDVLDDLINVQKLHRIEWHAVGTNPVCKAYDRFCKKYKGNKYVLHDSWRDVKGKFHDSYIYEILPNSLK